MKNEGWDADPECESYWPYPNTRDMITKVKYPEGLCPLVHLYTVAFLIVDFTLVGITKGRFTASTICPIDAVDLVTLEQTGEMHCQRQAYH